VKSSEWQASLELKNHKEKELKQCRELLQGSLRGSSVVNKDDLQRYVNVLQRQCEIDKQENERVEEEKTLFILDAVTHYVNCLTHGEKYDIRAMFRLCSLWFNHSNNKLIDEQVRKAIAKIPTKKFLPLIYQIASRISAADSSSIFQKTLGEMIELTATDHPHHVLYQLFALRNGDRVSDDHRGKSRFLVDQDKTKAASKMIETLKQKKLKNLIVQMEKLIGSYIELAFLDVSAKKKEAKSHPLISTIKDQKGLIVPVATLSLPVDPSCKYQVECRFSFAILFFCELIVLYFLFQDVPTIQSFEPNFSLVGGLNLPKLIVCNGSDGRQYKQLVKGRDDLRQDAVMQQIFQLVNTLLLENPETRRRRLKIRTYKVIPLAPTAGLLEWVENTVPLGEYLTGTPSNPNQGAHVRYRPHDKKTVDCRKELGAAAEKDKLKKFLEISAQFKPVFHHFFLENFSDPAEWFEKRLYYTRSCASNSIVGYVIGLGDRHSHNILIDKSTAELVHIDLGVAFEQGKTLRTPELVPFRLTRGECQNCAAVWLM
jgi:ataxia telangiectasia mutated family protein